MSSREQSEQNLILANLIEILNAFGNSVKAEVVVFDLFLEAFGWR